MEAGALLRAVLQGLVDDDFEAERHLAAALAVGVDPLDYCARRFGLGDALVLERAAAWADLTFAPRIPRTRPGSPLISRIERLGEVRTVRAMLFDREVVFAAPRFADLLRLAAQVRLHPDLRRTICLVPLSEIRAELARASEEALLDQARQRLVRRWPQATGGIDAPRGARLAFAGLLLTVLAIAVAAPWLSQPIFLPLAAALLVPPAFLRLWAALHPPPPPLAAARLADADLPVYSILLPLRDEARMVPQLAAAMRAIDYPPEKLDIRFVVETRSMATVSAVAAELRDPRFAMVLVPDAAPRTKPKAMNYALPLIQGDFVVVFDAEDIPDPDQLRRAAELFAAHPWIDCLQAELTIDNAEETWLSTMFAGEYAGLFGCMLPLLADLDLPVPLGGTSNHLRVSALNLVGGWDPFNVTEDADLGLRLARQGRAVCTFTSRTREEAPVTLGPWIRQRTRWMKGWMQTLIVHHRAPGQLPRDLGWWRLLGFELYIGNMVVSAPMHLLFIASFIVATLTGTVQGPDWWTVAAAAIFAIGYAAPYMMTLTGLERLGRSDLFVTQLTLPIYWVLHSVAALLALGELLNRPHFWAKTPHGRTRRRRPAVPVRAVAPAPVAESAVEPVLAQAE